MSREPLHISPQALFRYQWVAEIDACVRAGEDLSEVIESLLRHPRLDPRGRTWRPSRRSLYRWYAAFREKGIAGLEPVRRPPPADSQVLAPEFLDLMRQRKTADPELSVPDLIQIARTLGVLGSQQRSPAPRSGGPVRVWACRCGGETASRPPILGASLIHTA